MTGYLNAIAVNITLKVTKQNKYKSARNFFFKKDVKKTWTGIKSIVTLKCKVRIAQNLLIVNENVITNKNYTAEIFTVFFINVGSSLLSKIPKAKRSFNIYIRKSVVNFSLILLKNPKLRN